MSDHVNQWIENGKAQGYKMGVKELLRINKVIQGHKIALSHIHERFKKGEITILEVADLKVKLLHNVLNTVEPNNQELLK